MLDRYSHIQLEAKRIALQALVSRQSNDPAPVSSDQAPELTDLIDQRSHVVAETRHKAGNFVAAT